MKFKTVFMVKGKQVNLLCLGVGFVLGLIVFFIFNYFFPVPDTSTNGIQTRENNSYYKYINPLLECDVGSGISNGLSGFKSLVQDNIDSLINAKQADKISLYFRDMDNGPFFTINPTDTFIPGSLLKVPLMMAYYKYAESHPDALDEKITFTKVLDSNVQHFSAPGIVLGKTYTVEQLIEAMIINSDNNAFDLLLAHVDTSSLQDVFHYLGIVVPQDKITMNVEQYSAFFRILFNSSYLNNADSEHALSLLDQIHFTSGIQAGVPANVQVANKYGERIDDTNGKPMLHDCGIIYYPNHPYLLCVMTEGSDFDQLASVISNISQTVYSEVDRQETSH